MAQQYRPSKLISQKTPLLDDQLCFALYATSRAVMNVYRPALQQLGITYPQYLVLLVLWEADAIAVGALGERLFLDTGTLTPLLKRLEKQGLIRRIRNSEDERQVDIHLTLAGNRLKRRAHVMVDTLRCRLQLPISKAGELREELKRVMKMAASGADG